MEAAKSYAESHNAKLPDKTVEEVYQEMLAAKRRDGASHAYLGALRTYLGRFSRDFKDSIANVQTADMDAWLRKLSTSPRSRNNFRNSIQLLFNFAKSAGYLNRDRSTAAEHVAVARQQVEAIEIFTPSEFAKLLAAATDVVLPFFVFGGLAGLRTQEIVRLRWEDVRWPEKAVVISAAAAKTRTRRLAPLTPAAAAWLADWRGKTGKVITVERLRLHERVKDVCEAAGVTWKHNGLRHSWISYRLSQTKDFVRTAYEAGNSVAVIKSNYDAVVSKGEGKKWFAILPKREPNVVPMQGAPA